MKKNDLKKYSRTELLECLIEVRKENEALRAENEKLRQQLRTRTLSVEKFGTLAEAALGIAGVFEACDRACALYKENYMAGVVGAINSAVDGLSGGKDSDGAKAGSQGPKRAD